MLKKCLSAFLSFAIITTAGVGNLPADIFGNTVHAATTGTVINKYGINFRVESNQTLTVTGRDTNRTSVIIPTYIDGMKVAQVSAFSSSSSMPSVLEIPDPITNYGRLYASKLTVPSFSTSTSAKPLEITNTESISSNATLNRTVNDPSSLILNKKVKKFTATSLSYNNTSENVIVGDNIYVAPAKNDTSDPLIIPETVKSIYSISYINGSRTIVYPENADLYADVLRSSSTSKLTITGTPLIKCYYNSSIYNTLKNGKYTNYELLDGTEDVEKDTNFEYRLMPDGNYELARYIGSSTGDVSAPTEFNGKPVTSIGRKCFLNANISSITITNGIEKIKPDAFKNSKVKEVIIPDSVLSVGCRAFWGCKQFTYATIGDNVETIGDDAFYGCTSLTSTKIPISVKYLGESCFYGCTALTTATIGRGVTKINDLTFCKCTSLSSVTLPSTLTEIGDYAFEFCALERLNMPTNLKIIGKKAFAGNEALNRLTFRNNLTKIGDQAFARCYSLENISLPESITDESGLGMGCFEDCIALKSVDYPKNYTIAPCRVFFNCYSLNAITGIENLKDIQERAFAGTAFDEFVLPAGLTKIGDYAFEETHCFPQELYVPDKVYYIGKGAFANCTAILSASLPDTLATLGADPFYNTISVRIRAVDGTVKKEVYKSHKISSVYLENGIKEIQDNAFASMSSLNDFSMPDTVEMTGNEIFNNSKVFLTIRYDKGVIKEALLQDQWLAGIELEDGIYKIEDNALNVISNAYNIQTLATEFLNVSIPDTVTEVGTTAINANSYVYHKSSTSYTVNKANKLYLTIRGVTGNIQPELFKNNLNAVQVTVAENINNIGNSAFEGITVSNNLYFYCTTTTGENAFISANIKNFILGSGVDRILTSSFKDSKIRSFSSNGKINIIEDDAFRYTSNLTTFTVTENEEHGKGIGSIGNNAFVDNLNLKTVNITGDIGNIGNSAFANSAALTSVSVTGNIGTIGNSAFANSKALDTFSLGGSIGEISDEAFSECTALTTFTHNGGPTSIGNRAFFNCMKLKAFDNNEGLVTIGDEAFRSCFVLASMTAPDTLRSIGSYAFCDCKVLPEFNVPYGVTKINKYTFSGCSVLNIKLPLSVTEIDDYAYYGCVGEDELILPSNVKRIGSHSFYGCGNITNLNLPQNLEHIGEYAFGFMEKIQSLTIPDSVTEMEDFAFYECVALENVTLGSGIMGLNDGVFYDCPNLSSVYALYDLSYISDDNFYGACDDERKPNWLTFYCIGDNTVVKNYAYDNYFNYVDLSAGVTKGDINNDSTVNTEDADLLLKHLSGLVSLSANQLAAAKVNNDDAIDLLDVIEILNIKAA